MNEEAFANNRLHQILPSREGQTLRRIAEKVRAAGGRLWLVGGAVRDGLRGNPSLDLDAEVYGLTAEKLEAVLLSVGPCSLVGRAFAVWKMKGLSLDVALPRRERAHGRGHRDFTIEADPHLSLSEASRRRDFTINAILWDPLSGELADPTGGLADLEARVLRHTSPQFSEDPLRVLRAMQFAARFDLAVAPGTLDLCRRLSQDDLPPERLFEEWRKLIVAGRLPSRGLRFLREAGWIRFYPELAALIDCPQDPLWHPEGDVWEHTLHSLDAFAAHRTGDAREDLIVGLAVLCHDLGKPATTVFERGHWRSPNHESEGEGPTRSFLARLTREQALVEAVVDLVLTHMRPHQLHDARASDAAVRRLAMKIGRIDRLVRVAEADARGRPPQVVADYAPGQWLLERAQALTLANNKPQPIIRGRDLLQLGMKPGPKMGDLLQRLFEAQLDGKFDSRTDGLIVARELLASISTFSDEQGAFN